MSLLDVLEGRQRGRGGEGRLLSVAGSLDRLFRTRQGALAHRPDYGLPDLSSVYRDVPESIPDFQRALRTAVDRFEPRLADVRVTLQSINPGALRLVFVLSGRLVGHGPVQLQTTFRSGRHPSVAPWER